MQEGSKKKILLIDDDASLLLTLSDFLKFEGYDVITADSGEKGLKKLAKLTPDLIILDMSMPGMGGVGFLKEISSQDGKPKYPVLVLTARANMAEFFANIDVDGFIAKPCDPDDLLMEVARIVFLRSGGEAKPHEQTIEGRKTVLIGEDDIAMNEEMVKTFAAAGYDTDGVFSGPEVVEKAIVLQPDIIVLKEMLANMNGDAVARMLMEMPKTRVIPIVLYDDSDSSVSEARYTESGTGIKKFIRGRSLKSMLEAVKEVVG
jgi:DNA-binding response OmpR family regulator